ncbi:MAG: hypothetical protein V4654_12965 [Bdellovibrionota bacterium]
MLQISVFANDEFPSKILLFQNQDEVLDVTIETDFTKINDPDQTIPEIAQELGVQGMLDPKYFTAPGTLTYNQNGKTITIEGDFYPRGKQRRRYCRWKPLELDLQKKQMTGSLFEGGRSKLKVVTHCNATTELETEIIIRKEFLSYRLLHALNAKTFLVKLARIRYVDKGGGPTVTHFAFFMENRNDLAERLGGQMLDLTREEEEAPATSEELGVLLDYRRMYGDYVADKYLSRVRVSKKHFALQAQQGVQPDFLYRLNFLTKSVASVGADYRPLEFSNLDSLLHSDGKVELIKHDLGFVHTSAPHTDISRYTQNLVCEVLGTCNTLSLPVEVRRTAKAQILYHLQKTLDSFTQSSFKQQLQLIAELSPTEQSGVNQRLKDLEIHMFNIQTLLDQPTLLDFLVPEDNLTKTHIRARKTSTKYTALRSM